MAKISGESCIFIGNAPAQLLFEPSGPVRIDNPVTGKTFLEKSISPLTVLEPFPERPVQPFSSRWATN